MIPQPSSIRPVERKPIFLRKWPSDAVDGRWTRPARLRTGRITPSSSQGGVTPGCMPRARPSAGRRSGVGRDVHGQFEHHAAHQLDTDVVLAHRLDRFVDRKDLVLDEPIKTVGEHNVRVELVGGVVFELTVNVVAEAWSAGPPAEGGPPGHA